MVKGENVAEVNQVCAYHEAVICMLLLWYRVDLVLDSSSLPLVQWVRHTAGQQVDLVVHLTMAWVGHDPSPVVRATARRLYKASTWCLASVDQKMDISLLPDQVFRSVSSCLVSLTFCCIFNAVSVLLPSALWLCWLGGRKGIRPLKTQWWGTGEVICLE